MAGTGDVTVRRICIAVSVLGASVVWLSAPQAHAEAPKTGGERGPDGGIVIVIAPGSKGLPSKGTTPTSGSGSTSPVVCSYYTDDGTPVGDPASIGLPPGTWLVLACSSGGEPVGNRQRVQWFPGVPLPTPMPTADELAQVALGRLAVPLPAVQTWPPDGGTSLVNVPVWLHISNWAQLTASASAGGLTATITAKPIRSEWNLREDSIDCDSAGSVYDSSRPVDAQGTSCPYTYRHSSGTQADGTYRAAGTLVWHMRWDATNGQGGDLGEISRTTAFTLRVEESQAVVVSAG